MGERHTQGRARQPVAAIPATTGLLMSLVVATTSPAAAENDDGDDLSTLFAYLASESLDATVEIATRSRSLSIDEAPAAVDVITALQIQQRGYRTVAEALRSLSGLATIDDHLYVRLGIRGIYSDSESPNDIVKVMIDGQPVSFRANSGNFLDHELIPIDAVEKIEIVKGPGSALYGANAFLGVINIITRSPEGKRCQWRGRAHLEPYFTGSPVTLNHETAAMSSGRCGRLSHLVAVSMARADRSGLQVPGLDDIAAAKAFEDSPELATPALGYPSPGHPALGRSYFLRQKRSAGDVERKASALAQVSYRLGEGATLRLDSNLQFSDSHGEFQDWSTLTHENRITYLHGYLRLRLAHEGKNGLSTRAAVAFATGRPTGAESIADPEAVGLLRRRLFGYRALDASAEWSYATSSWNTLSGGVDLTVDREDLLSTAVRTADGQDSVLDGFGTRHFTNIGVFAQWLTQVPRLPLRIALGTRIEHNTAVACNIDVWNCFVGLADTREQVSPLGAQKVDVTDRGLLQASSRLGAVFHPPGLPLHVKLLYGSSFKPPSPFQLFHERLTITSSQGNPALKPQTADTFELLVGYRPGPDLSLRAGGFSTSVSDAVFFFNERGTVQGRNADLLMRGLEAQADAILSDQMSGYVHGTLLLDHEVEPRKRENESDLAFRHTGLAGTFSPGMFPRWQVGAGANLLLEDAYVNANVELNLAGARQASLSNAALYRPDDLSAAYELPSRLSVNFTLTSLDLELWEGRETRVKFSVRDAPGQYVDPGFRGVDIPSLGTRVHLAFTQEL